MRLVWVFLKLRSYQWPERLRVLCSTFPAPWTAPFWTSDVAPGICWDQFGFHVPHRFQLQRLIFLHLLMLLLPDPLSAHKCLLLSPVSRHGVRLVQPPAVGFGTCIPLLLCVLDCLRLWLQGLWCRIPFPGCQVSHLGNNCGTGWWSA